MTALGPGTGKNEIGKDHLDDEKVLLIARGKTELKIIGTDKAIWRQRGALIASSAREGAGGGRRPSGDVSSGQDGARHRHRHRQPERAMCSTRLLLHRAVGSSGFANSP